MSDSIYLQTAIQVAHYLEQFEIRDKDGIYWDISNSFQGDWEYYDNISLYAGSSGIIKFLIDLYHATDDKRFLSKAIKAGKHIVNRLLIGDELVGRAFSKFAFTTGLGGVIFVLDELYTETTDTTFSDIVKNLLDEIVSVDNGKGAWSGQIGITADGGTALLLIKLAQKYQIQGAKERLYKFGQYVLSQKRVDKDGQQYYLGMELHYVNGAEGKFNSGFPLGPSGVAFTLLKLWEYTGEKSFFEGTEAIDEFYHYHSIDSEKIFLPRLLPDDNHICYVGYCAGPAGTARYFYEEYLKTKETQYLDDFENAIAGLTLVNAPYERSKGFWEIDNYCCGTSGILQLFIAAYIITGKEKYLTLAKDTGDILIKRAKSNENGIYWEQAFEQKNPNIITVALGYYDGISGIASSLIQLDGLLKGKFSTVRLVDDPFPSRWEK